MNKNDINGFMPSLLYPRTFKKEHNAHFLTQNSVASRCSLSLRRNNGIVNKSQDSTNSYLKLYKHKQDIVQKSLTNAYNKENLEERRTDEKIFDSLGLSAIEDLETVQLNQESCSISDISVDKEVQLLPHVKNENIDNFNKSCISVSSTKASDAGLSEKTIIYFDEPTISIQLGVNNCKKIDISTKRSCLKRVFVASADDCMNVDCEVFKYSQVSSVSNIDMNDIETCTSSPTKKDTVAVNIEIKRKKVSDLTEENSKVLILNTNAIEKLSHVIVQPPNYKIVKRQSSNHNKIKGGVNRIKAVRSQFKNEKIQPILKQRSIEEYLCGKSNDLRLPKVSDICTVSNSNEGIVDRDVVQDMSKNSGVADGVKYDRLNRLPCRSRKGNESPKGARPPSRRSCDSPRIQDIKVSSSEAPRSPRAKNDSSRSHSPRKNVESIQFTLHPKPRSIKSSNAIKTIPHHKIVAGTHFAVDAFSYGEIPNVKHYFLTHFHSDHYSGLKKGFNKILFCTKITADLCISRLGVNPKYIHVINPDEFLRIEGVEVTAIDANHCPGAVMLVFTLPNGKTMLHTGDFRATPIMESYPIFWNKDIHTIYLDTTYCNPRYDFPTQDQSLEMALFQLRQKKMVLEKEGKKFSSVLIVCGTYTIGKEKFFLGMARRVGCSVWACPEKDRVLQAVEGRSFSDNPPHSCQLHVVPMRDLTHEKLRSYLDSLQGAFSEVVAFKPSGWENGKNSSVEKDMVTIHGIPYSEHSSFSEMIRFVKYLKPRQVVPTVDISGGIKAVQKFFPCPLVNKEDIQFQSKVTDFFSIQNRSPVPAVT